MENKIARHLLRIGLRTLPAAFDRSNGSAFAVVLGACAAMITRACLIVVGLLAWPILGLVLGTLMFGCGGNVRTPSPEGCSEPHNVYHRATLETDRCPLTYADLEAEYRHALEDLGGCPFYLYRDEWCPALDVPEAAPESAAWFAHSFSHVEACRDLYWTRGAYCHALEEGRYP